MKSFRRSTLWLIGPPLGSDGLPYEFYKHFSKDLVPILLEVFNGVTIIEGCLPSSHRHSLTTLLYKKGDEEEIKNYRPISLTQCDYKIFTKALTNRINPIANNLIGAWQTGFIPGRQGHDNVLMLDLVTYELHRGDQGDGALLSLDQEKAYDRVEWSYLHKVLEKFGFGPRIRTWIKACYSDLFATILLRGRQSDRYIVQRGLRQGDPLAPILFNFVLEPFLLYYNRHAKGCLREPIPFKVSAFADDTTLGVGPEDKDVAQEAIRLHERASGAKVNVQKTETIPLTATSEQSMVIPGFPMKGFREPFKHLGVIIQSGGRDMTAIETEIIVQLRRSVRMMYTRRLSFTGRITALNTYLLSKIWHVAPFYDFSTTFFDDVDTICKELLWNSSKARVSLSWFQRPREEGGYGLINVHHQVVALKAKFIARLATSRPKWHDLLIKATGDGYNLVSQRQAKTFLRIPDTRDFEESARQVVVPLIRAQLQLDAKEGVYVDKSDNDRLKTAPLVAGKIPAHMYTVHAARRYLDEKVLDDWKTKPVSNKPYLRAPISKHMRWIDNRHWVKDDPDAIKLNDAEWHRTWKRLFSKHRLPKEKEFMFLLSHRVVNTNGRKSQWLGLRERVDPQCRRCLPEHPPLILHETHRHAFYECPTVQEQWKRLHLWVQQVFPNLALPSSLLQDTMCWPAVAHLPPVLIHLHATVMAAIWRSYCALGDGETLEKDELRWMIVHSFKERAKLALRHARLKEQRARERPHQDPDDDAGTDQDQNESGGKGPVEAAIKIWHHPPFIEMTLERVSMGDLWWQV